MNMLVDTSSKKPKGNSVCLDSNSALMRYKIAIMNGPRQEASRAIWEHPNLTRLMPWVMVRTYLISNGSVPLMQAALERCKTLSNKDTIAAALVPYFEEHIEEERGHDEQFLADIEFLGLSREQVLQKLPYPSLVALIGMQYYWINHQHPVAFLGYAATIEGDPVPETLIDETIQVTQLPAEGFKTLRWHSKFDPDHTSHLDAVVDQLPLSESQHSLIGVNIAHTHAKLAASVYEMITDFEQIQHTYC